MNVLLKLLALLPLGLLYALGDAIYLVIYRLWGFRRRLSLDNLRRCFPDKPEAELESIAARSYRNGCALMAEVVKGSRLPAAALSRRVVITNPQIVQQVLSGGKPAVLLASHHCNWEWLLLSACVSLNTGVDAVYKPLREAGVDRFMRETRSRFGGNPIPVGSFMMEVMKRRSQPRIIALVADQTPPWNEDKHWTRFLNQDTAFFTGADQVARIARAPVFFVGMRRLKRGYYEATLQLLTEPPYPPTAEGGDSLVIERYARAAEAHIAAYPADWLWMYRKWKYPKPLYD